MKIQIGEQEDQFVWADEYGEDRGSNRVLALHGWMDNAGTWARLAPLLAQPPFGWYVVAIDFPGHGRSFHKGPTATYPLSEMVLDTFLVVRRLGWRSCSVLAHSMGGAVAFLLAALAGAQQPGDDGSGVHFQRMVIVDSPGPFAHVGSDTDAVVRSMRDSLHANLLRFEDILISSSDGGGAAAGGSNGAPRKQRRLYASVDEAAEQRSRMDPFLTVADARCLVEPALRRTDGGQFEFMHDPRIKSRSLYRLHEDVVVQLFSAIACPVFCVFASHGIIQQALKHEKGRAAIVARLKSLRQYAETTVPDTGHHLHLTHPEAVRDELRNYLANNS